MSLATLESIRRALRGILAHIERAIAELKQKQPG